MNNVTQIKRGSTSSWVLGPNLINFNNYSARRKDSIISCEGNKIVFETGTGSRNTRPGGTQKEPLQFLILSEECVLVPSLYDITAKATNLAADAIITIGIINSGIFDPLFNLTSLNSETRWTYAPSGYVSLVAYVQWNEPDEGTADLPYGQGHSATLQLSVKDVHGNQTLAPGQFGLEESDVGPKLKIGLENDAYWDTLPYINAPSLAGRDDVYWSYTNLEPILSVPAMNAEGYWICADTPYRSEVSKMDITIGNRKLQHISNIIIDSSDLYAFTFDGQDTFLIAYTAGDIETELGFTITVPRRGLYQMWNTGTHISNTYRGGGTLIYPKQKIPQTQANLKETNPYSIAYVRNKPEGLSALTPSKEDEGKLLQVINGVPTWSINFGDLDAALDTILAIQKELIGVTLITFITPTGEYQAEDGMTWGEWIDSQYNTDGFVINGLGWIEDGDGGLIYDYADGGSPEEPSYVIIAGHTYIYD